MRAHVAGDARRLPAAVMLMLLAAACTRASAPSTQPPTEPTTMVSTTTTTAAPIVVWMPRLEMGWAPETAAADEQAISAALTEVGAVGLFPPLASSEGKITVNEEYPIGVMRADIVSWPLDVVAMPSGQSGVTCARRISGEFSGGVGPWSPVEVAGFSGCTSTNEAGVTFIEWDDGVGEYHVETRLPPDEAVADLAQYRRLP